MSNSGKNGKHLPYAVIPLLAILGACAAVLICWSFFRVFGEEPDEFHHFSDQQTQYMRDVRQRNRSTIAEKFWYRSYRMPSMYSATLDMSEQRDSRQYE